MWRGGLWIFKGASGFPFLLIIAMLSGNHGPIHQTARILGTVADLSEAATSTAITAINASSTMATAASTLMVQAASNGLDASANMWHGVDVTDIYANKCGGAVITSSVPALTAWLNTDAAMVHFPCLSPFLVTRLKSAAMSITTEVPYTQAVSEELQLNESLTSLRVTAQKVNDHQLRIAFESTTLLYQLRWSNPVWEQMGFSLHTEREQVLRTLRLLLLDLPSAPARPEVVPWLHSWLTDIFWHSGAFRDGGFSWGTACIWFSDFFDTVDFVQRACAVLLISFALGVWHSFRLWVNTFSYEQLCLEGVTQQVKADDDRFLSPPMTPVNHASSAGASPINSEASFQLVQAKMTPILVQD